MAPYRRAYNFTGEPGATEDPADWLAALETNIYQSTTNREKVDLFSSKLLRGSPARKWFNKLPDEGHRWFDIVRQEFVSRWCNNVDSSDTPSAILTLAPALVAMLSTDVPAIIPAHTITHTSSPLSSPATPQIVRTTAPITAISSCKFCKFLKHADYENLSRFCDWAYDTAIGANLKSFQMQAIEEGRKLGIEEGEERGRAAE
jgi:hypothetical protein